MLDSAAQMSMQKMHQTLAKIAAHHRAALTCSGAPLRDVLIPESCHQLSVMDAAFLEVVSEPPDSLFDAEDHIRNLSSSVALLWAQVKVA